MELLDIQGSIVTIDAMGTQVDIAQKIIENGADYILSVKGNQKELLDQLKGRFEKQSPTYTDTTNEKGHGRIESRKCEVITGLAFVDNSVFLGRYKVGDTDHLYARAGEQVNNGNALLYQQSCRRRIPF